MGMEIQVDSLEDMCSLMCDNVIPKKKQEKEETWYFTFGYGQEHEGHYVTFTGSYAIAREKMCERFGDQWAFQYSEKEWKKIENDPKRWWPLETPLGE